MLQISTSLIDWQRLNNFQFIINFPFSVIYGWRQTINFLQNIKRENNEDDFRTKF